MSGSKKAQHDNGDISKHSQFRRLLVAAVWIVSLLVVYGTITWALIGVSRWLNPKISDPVQFVTGNLLNALIFGAIVAQVLIYRKQRDIMEEQGVHIKSQAQLTLYAARPIIEIEVFFQPNGDVLFMLSNIGKSRAIAQFRCKVFFGRASRKVLDEEISKFEIGLVGQAGHGKWNRTFRADVSPNEIDGVIHKNMALKMELIGKYEWEAGIYPINERKMYAGGGTRKFESF